MSLTIEYLRSCVDHYSSMKAYSCDTLKSLVDEDDYYNIVEDLLEYEDIIISEDLLKDNEDKSLSDIADIIDELGE